MLIEGILLRCAPPPAPAACLERGWVRLAGPLIAGTSAGAPPGTPDLGSPETLVLPGLIDAHVHLPQFDSIGVDGLPLLEWLRAAVFPAEALWADADHAGAMTARVAARLLAHGTTAVAAYATVHHGGTRAAIEALHAAGLRALVGQVLMDREAPAELLRPAKTLLAEAAALAPPAGGRIAAAVTPRFAVSCSPELLAGAGDLARRTGQAVQTHLSETPEECRLVERLHGAPYTAVYHRAGLLGPRSILGHGVWLDGSDRALLAASGSVVAHCPTANLFLGAGSMDRAALHAAGVRTALGSDVAGGPDVSMVRIARAMIETAKRRRMAAADAGERPPPLPAAAEAWRQITAGNAAALGFSDTGRLEAGAAADVLLVEPARGPAAEPGWLRSPDPLSTLLYAWDDRWLRLTIVGGRIGYRGG